MRTVRRAAPAALTNRPTVGQGENNEWSISPRHNEWSELYLRPLPWCVSAVSGETSLCPACYCQVVSYRAHECDVCGAEEGRPCVASGGRVCAEAHAIR